VSKLRDVNDLPAQNKIKKTSTILVPNGNRTDFKADGNSAASSSESALQGTGTDLSANPEHGSANINLADSENDSFSSESNDENEPKQNRSVRHKVKKGEVMATIAKRYGVSVKQIMAANSLKTNRVNAGQVLSINITEDSNTNTNKAKNTKKTQTYIVKRGDTLHSIAQKFDVAVADLKRWNKKYGNRIQPGNKLTIKQSDAA